MTVMLGAAGDQCFSIPAWPDGIRGPGASGQARPDQAGLVGDHDQLGPVSGAELGHHPVDVGLGGQRADLAARCAQGRLDAKGRAVSRAARKRALTAGASSRWAGAITRTSEDQWQLAERNLRAEAASLRAQGDRGTSGRPGGPEGRPGARVCHPSRVVVDPAYTSRWGAEHWLAPLREHHPKATGHHAAALVTGRRGLGHRARRRATGNQPAPEEAARPAQARPRTPPASRPAPRNPATSRGPRHPPGSKTGRPHRIMAGNQAAQDRPGRRPARTISR